jgi:hypothetical protein
MMITPKQPLLLKLCRLDIGSVVGDVGAIGGGIQRR